MRKQIDGLAALVQTQLGAASESGAVGGSSMRVSAAGNMPLQGLVKPPAKPVVMTVFTGIFSLWKVLKNGDKEEHRVVGTGLPEKESDT